jgi:hypothetical protein
MDVLLKCDCGAVQGLAKDVALASGNNTFVCYCRDCQSYGHFLKRAKEVLDINGGTEIVPVVPAKIEITQGFEKIKCLRLSPKGMFRWYAGCCNTPIANIPGNPKTPYAGVVHNILKFESPMTCEKLLGTVFGRVQGKSAIGKPPEGTSDVTSLRVIIKVLRFLVPAYLKGQAQPNPFFDSKFAPKVSPQIISLQEREELLRHCGPHPTV